MTIKEVEYILTDHRKKTQIYNAKKTLLYSVWVEMQNLNAVKFDKVSVQGGEKQNRLEKLLDKEFELSQAVQKALYKKTEAYESAMKLIFLLPIKDNMQDVLADFYLGNYQYIELAKKYNYDTNCLYVKLYRAKRTLAKIATAKGLTVESFKRSN